MPAYIVASSSAVGNPGGGSPAVGSLVPSNTGSPRVNCSVAEELQPNPDISGIGVLLGFAISAYLTLFFCAAYFYIDLEDASNPIDRLFLEKFSPKSSRNVARKWSEALRSAVLALGDSQIVSGISILVSGYIQLVSGLQYYHWRIVVDLAFFASITHLTTLTCLRSYLQKRPAIRLWRLICMGVIAVMLAVAMGSIGYFDRGMSWPAICFLTHNFINLEGLWDKAMFDDYDYNILYMAIILCFLSFSYLSRVLLLFPSVQTSMLSIFRSRPSNAIHKRLALLRDRVISSSSKFTGMIWLLAYRLLLCLYCLSKAMVDLYGSLLWEITWLALALAWGTIVVWRDRGGASDNLNPEQTELLDDDTWGFGQVFPLVLLILPLVSFFEVAYDSVFPPAEKQFEADLSNVPLTRAPGESSYVAYSAVPHVSEQLDTNSLIPGNPSPNHDFYQYPWFCRLIILIYGLTFGLAGITLWLFAYDESSNYIQDNLMTFARLYVPWLAYDFGAVWIFTLASSCLSHPHPYAIPHLPIGFRLHRIPLLRWRWTSSFVGNFFLLALLGSSATIGYVITSLWAKWVKVETAVELREGSTR